MSINHENGTVDFSSLHISKDKENFVKFMIIKQISFAKFMNDLYEEVPNILPDHLILMEAVL